MRLFKRPNEMIEAIKEQPDVVGLAYYVWNANSTCVLERTTVRHTR